MRTLAAIYRFDVPRTFINNVILCETIRFIYLLKFIALSCKYEFQGTDLAKHAVDEHNFRQPLRVNRLIFSIYILKIAKKCVFRVAFEFADIFAYAQQHLSSVIYHKCLN